MRATIIADASWCPNTHAAGYGYWIASDRGKQGGSGAIKDRVVNSIAAEMMALLNGLHDACRRGLVGAKDEALLQTDCQAAIDAFNGVRKNISSQELELVAYLAVLQKKVGFTVKFRHVKGHGAGDTARSFVNNTCDKLARSAMQRARAQLQRELS
jgi:ribonuclease HI